MATKTPTRPKQRQSAQKRDSLSRQSRTWKNLTDRRKLRHSENTLDKAITKALQEGGIEPHEDFKVYVEAFSERSGKAPSLLSFLRVVAMMMKFEATASISAMTPGREPAASI